MKQAERRGIVSDLYYNLGRPLDEIASRVASLAKLALYSTANVRYDLWFVACTSRVGTRIKQHFASEAMLESGELAADPWKNLLLARIARAYGDLERGSPCTLGMSYLMNEWSGCYQMVPTTVDGNPRWAEITECHSCSLDALAWLTSGQFFRACQELDWDWSAHMEVVLRIAENNASVYPFIILTPALVWRVACILQGEAAGMGAPGFFAVGDTMLGRRAMGQTWETVLSAYYANERPSEEAMAIAVRMLSSPWEPSGRIFAYSNTDRARMGWPEGDEVLTVNGQTLHLAASLED